jgi:pimeloyl-ACP methyl ester carboxylesterase
MPAEATLLDNDLQPRLQALQARLAQDPIVATLPPPTQVAILLEIAGSRFIVAWNDTAILVKTSVGPSDHWDFGFTVPEAAWKEFTRTDPGPLNNTAQAMVAQFGEAIISGDKVKWAQYCAHLERILFCLKPVRDRGVAPQLPRKSAITATYLTIDYAGREYRIFYEESGQGIPMVCLHTAGSDSRQYKYMLEDPELQADFRMIAFDMPWHGRSMPPRGWRSERYELSIQFYVGIIREFVKALGLDKPVLIGCSMGGAVTLVMAGLHGEEYRAICSLEGCLGHNPKAPSRRAIGTRHMEVDHSFFLSTWVAGLMSPRSPQDLQDDVLWEYGQSGPGVYNGDAAMPPSLEAVGKTLGKTKCPLYVFSGDYDYSATPEMSKLAADQLGGEFIPMINKGHFPMAEDPVGFKEDLMPVLARIKQLGS